MSGVDRARECSDGPQEYDPSVECYPPKTLFDLLLMELSCAGDAIGDEVPEEAQERIAFVHDQLVDHANDLGALRRLPAEDD